MFINNRKDDAGKNYNDPYARNEHADSWPDEPSFARFSGLLYFFQAIAANRHLKLFSDV